MPSANYAAILRRCQLFRDLTEADLAHIATATRLMEYERGAQILQQAGQGHALFLIVSGVAKVQLSDPRGRSSTLAYLSVSDAFGEISLFTGEAITASVLAYTPLTVLQLSAQAVLQLLAASPQLAYNLIRSLCVRVRESDQLVSDLTFKNLEGRTAAKLLHLADRFGVPTEHGTQLTLPLTHAELAELVGTNRETVTKIMGTFKREGSVDTPDRMIVILDRDKLLAWTRQ